jgi:hypothetical protein
MDCASFQTPGCARPRCNRLRNVGLADDDCVGLLKSFHNYIVFVGNKVLISERSGNRSNARSANQIFDSDGNAGERTDILTGEDCLLNALRFAAR